MLAHAEHMYVPREVVVVPDLDKLGQRPNAVVVHDREVVKLNTVRPAARVGEIDVGDGPLQMLWVPQYVTDKKFAASVPELWLWLTYRRPLAAGR